WARERQSDPDIRPDSSAQIGSHSAADRGKGAATEAVVEVAHSTAVDEAVELGVGYRIKGILPVVTEFGQTHDPAVSRALAPVVAAQKSRSTQAHFLDDEQRFRRHLALSGQTKAEAVTD